MTSERWQELVSAGVALVWGVVLLLPGDLFAGIQRYVALAVAVPDWVWGLLLLAFGLTVILLSPLRWRKEAHAGLGVVWTLVVILIFLDGVTPAGVLIAALCGELALLHFYRYLQLSLLTRL